MDTYLDSYIEELLHINDGKRNKLIDLEAGDLSKTYRLTHGAHVNDLAEYAVGVIQKRYGKTGNTLLRDSASKGEQVIGKDVNDFNWIAFDGSKDVKRLNLAIDNVYSELHLKGNNPLFLSVGALTWKIPVARDEVKDVYSPLLIFPIRLTRSTATSPVHIEFVKDDAYFNPCLIAKLRQVLGSDVADSFPHPNGMGAFDEAVSLEKLGDGAAYFASVFNYVESCRKADTQNRTVFSFNKNVVAIAQYNHDELCMYYDIKRNRDKIYAHPLVKKVFTESAPEGEKECRDEPLNILSCDSVQQDIIRRVYNGESMIIKGPPGTGKTQTIANMIAALLYKNKKVLLVSKKLSALSEVNAKLPEPLRKFVLPLFYETENQAAKVNPVNIKAELRNLIKSKKEYTFNAAVRGRREQCDADLYDAVKFIDSYTSVMFADGVIAGGSYYDALDIYLKNDFKEVEFCDGEAALSVTRAQYNSLLSSVEDAGHYYNIMTGGGSHDIKLCPWYGAEKCVNDNSAFDKYASLTPTAAQVLSDAPSYFTCAEDLYKDIKLATVSDIMRSPLNNSEAQKVISLTDNEEYIALTKAYNGFLRVEEECGEEFCPLSDEKRAEELLSAMNGKYLDSSVTPAVLSNFANGINIFYDKNGNMLPADNIRRVTQAAVKVDALLKEAKEHLAAAFTVFSEKVCREQDKLILDGAEKLAAYTKDSQKASLMDFKGAKAYKKLCAYAIGGKTFGDVATACKEFKAADGCAAQAGAITGGVYLIINKRISEEDAALITELAKKAEGVQRSTEEYIAMVKDISSDIVELAALTQGGSALPSGKLVKGCRAAVALNKLCNELYRITGGDYVNGREIVKDAARSALAIHSLCSCAPYKFNTAADNLAAVNKIKAAPESAKNAVITLLEGLDSFGKECFDNYYTVAGNLTYGNLAIFDREADDRNIYSAAMKYFAVINDGENALPLNAFFKYFEDNGDLSVQFAQQFEHSFYYLATKAVMARMGLIRNGLGKTARLKLDKAEKALLGAYDANVSLIENRCMSRINAGDKDFAFLVSERDPGDTLRSLFKKYPAAILKLKSCFIITPSTASVLFRPEEYEKFDVVIVDEASQLEPVNLLPVLFRAAQCVIVGDEWQMPPITHFETKAPLGTSVTQNGEVSFLEPEISALTLALRNHALIAKELVCHYRSKTESLITFSQKQFYPNMRTFPSPEPIKEGLGFAHIYIEDGRCDGGVNEAEARKVLEVLREHFNRYYNSETGVLSRSFGVVAFGEKQINRIVELVERDKELSAKRASALYNFKDVPEKLMFFKTIETVQGQETQHLILSITYGKDKEGKIVQRYGELNRDKLGKCIFNVAVTRAQSQVTLIHSVKPEDITGENVSYIRSYIQTVERYSREGRSQFVSEVPQKGFLQDVAAYIKSCGIEENRIVFNYGVTEGSVRMPVAILSADMRRAVLGIWCEKPVGKKYDYFDYNMRYIRNFKNCGWNIYTINIHDWVDNAEAEKTALAEALKNI